MSNRKKKSPPQAVQSSSLPWWLAKGGAAKFNRDLAAAKEEAAEWVDAYRRLSPFAQNEAYNLLMADASTPFGRLCSFLDMARRGLRAQRDKYKTGPRQKRARLEERHRIIDKLIDQGIKGEEEIFRFLQEHHGGLVRTTKGNIGSKDMMKTYRKARRQG
jgi:hypothetical protein